MKYTFFGRDVKDHTVVTVNSGEQKATVGPATTQTVEIPAATSSSTEEHHEMSAKGKPGRKIDASGARFIGYAGAGFQSGEIGRRELRPGKT